MVRKKKEKIQQTNQQQQKNPSQCFTQMFDSGHQLSPLK